MGRPGEGPYASCVFDLLPLHGIRSGSAGFNAGSIPARVPIAEKLPGRRRIVLGMAGAAEQEFADRSLSPHQARPGDGFDRRTTADARRENGDDFAHRWIGGGTRGERAAAGSFTKAFTGA